jgi:hypothetical protein
LLEAIGIVASRPKSVEHEWTRTLSPSDAIQKSGRTRESIYIRRWQLTVAKKMGK